MKVDTARNGGHILDTMPPVLAMRPDGIEPSHADSKSGHVDRHADDTPGANGRNSNQNTGFPGGAARRSAWGLNRTPATRWTPVEPVVPRKEPPDCLPAHLSREQFGILEFRLSWFYSRIARDSA